MCDFYTKYVKILEICKRYSKKVNVFVSYIKGTPLFRIKFFYLIQLNIPYKIKRPTSFIMWGTII